LRRGDMADITKYYVEINSINPPQANEFVDFHNSYYGTTRKPEDWVWPYKNYELDKAIFVPLRDKGKFITMQGIMPVYMKIGHRSRGVVMKAKIVILIILGLLLLCSSAFAATYTATSISDLNTKVANASAGDTIILANGTYTDTTAVIIDARRKGTSAGSPLIIRAETDGRVIITGNRNNAGWRIYGDYVQFRGFTFPNISGTGEAMLELIAANHCTVSYCKFINVTTADGVIQIQGIEYDYRSYVGPSTYNTISRCLFKDCDGVVVIEVFIVDEQRYPAADLGNTHNTISECVFKNQNSDAAIQIGRGSAAWSGGTRGYPSEQPTNAYTTVERSLFYLEGLNQQETIQSKCSSNTFRNNVFINPGGWISLRGGDNSVVDGNWSYRDGTRSTSYGHGVRISGRGHVVKNNWIVGATSPTYQTLGAIALFWGNGTPTAVIPDASNVTIANNTILNSTRGYMMYQYSKDYPDPPTNCTFINNLGENNGIYNTEGIFGYEYAGTGHTWITNRGHVTSGELVHSGITVTDSGSLKVTNSVANAFFNYLYPASYHAGTYTSSVRTDIDGDARPSSPTGPSIGCDETGSGHGLLNSLLNLFDQVENGSRNASILAPPTGLRILH
jgi:poly(beta-D-mannuronate) lyase